MDREERQENELQFVQEVYGAVDLRSYVEPGKGKNPPEYKIEICSDSEVGSHQLLSLTLNVRYPPNYPDQVAHLKLTESKGITSNQLKDFQVEIEKLAVANVGTEVIFDVVHYLEDRLRDQTQPPVSLHEEMVINHQKEVDEQKRREEEKRLKSEKERREIEAQIQEQQKRRIKEVNQHYPALRKQTALIKVDEEESVFEEPDGVYNNALDESMVPLFAKAGAIINCKPDKKQLAMNGDVLSSVATCISNIQRGKCIGHNDNGYAVYIGMDTKTGDLVAIYEWILRCRQTKSDIYRRQKQVSSIRSDLDKLQQLMHPHLVQYLEMRDYLSDYNTITVEILMEYVGGGSVSNHMRSSTAVPVNVDILRRYTKQLLEAIYYLHSRGEVHKDIKLSSLLLDSIGHLKLAGAGIVKRLCDLHKAVNQSRPTSSNAAEDDVLQTDPVAWAETKGGKKGDVLKLGLVVLCMALGQVTVSYPPLIPRNFPEPLQDFIMKCVDANEHSRSTVKQLLQHPFVQLCSIIRSPSEVYFANAGTTPADPCKNVMNLLRRDSVTGTPIVPKNLICSRLRTEFEEIEFLGKGGFGDVVKVRNHLDGNVYAIKRIELYKENKQMYKKITREVRLLSNLNHENVVRYFNSWIETYSDSGDNLKKKSSLEEVSSDDDDYDDEDYDDDDDDDEYDFEDEDDQPSDLSTEEDDCRNFSRSSSHDSYITFEASHGSDTEFDESFRQDDNALSTLDDTFTSDDQLASIDSDLAKTKFLMDSSDAVVFADSSSQQDKMTLTLKPQRKKPSRSSDGHVQYLYIQMEYCEKNTLRQLIDTAELHKNEEEVWRLFRELVEGLAHIHSRDVIHRDLKPGNIFLSSSGHIKIGDFGLATTHTFHRQSSVLIPDTSTMFQEVTGPVGTALYTSPEVLYSTGPASTRYSDKVDIFSLGIIFFEMCHVPCGTEMERYEVLSNLRKEEMAFPSSFDEVFKSREAAMVRMLLVHDARGRPSSKELIRKYLPLKLEDADFAHALEQTVSMPDSTRYHLLLDQLFSQPVSTLSQVLYSIDQNKFSMQLTAIQHRVHRTISSIFSKHGAILLKTPLLLLKDPTYDDTEHLVNLMDKRGSLVTLPYDLRVPFAKYVYNHDITYLKRYTISRVYRENRLSGAHPRELFECAFDIITPSSGSFLPDAEVMYIVSEVLAQFPEMQQQDYKIILTHTNLLSALLKHSGIVADIKKEVYSILHSLIAGTIKDSQLEAKFNELKLSPGAVKQLLNFVKSEVPIEEAKVVLEPLLNNRSAGDGSSTVQAWQEIETVVSHLKLLGIKEPVCLHLGLVPRFEYFKGIIFQYIGTRMTKGKARKGKSVVLAAGGRYDELVRKGKSELSAVGVSISAELIFTAVALQSRMKDSEYACTRCSVLVCWTGQRNFQKECAELVKQLWDSDISAEILYDSLQMDTVEDIQEFCTKNLIKNFVMFDDLYPSKKQVHLWMMNDKVFTDKRVNVAEVADRVLCPEKFDQEKCGTTETTAITTSRTNILSNTSENPTMSSSVNIVQTNIILSETGKMPGHLKRKYQDQAYSKMHSILQKIGVRSAELLIVELKADALSTIAAEVNKLLQLENNDINISQLKTATESLESVSRRYLNRVLEAIEKSLSEKRSPVLVLFSCSSEHYQLILDVL